MNKLQICVLQKNGYMVIPTLNYIKDEKCEYPLVQVIYNSTHNKFELKLMPSIKQNLLYNDAISYINSKLDLINTLNNM